MSAPRNSAGHQPVLVDAVVDLLITDDRGAYLDLTAGLGGHLRAMAQATGSEARLYGIEIDPASAAQAKELLREYVQVKDVVCRSYVDLVEAARGFSDAVFDGILADLGLSSFQLDTAERGFSYRIDGPLDMRFDPQSHERTAADLVNGLDQRRLAALIREFGEERRAAGIARAIVRERRQKMIRTTSQLAHIVTTVVPRSQATKSLSRVFQALRIAVNEELDNVAAMLPRALSLLRPGGRMAVISYHSLEDRLVKRFFQSEARGCSCSPELPVCTCRRRGTVRLVTKRVVRPQTAEIAANPKARSARLRVAERLVL